MYCYEGNNIIYFDHFGNRVIDWHNVGDPDFPEEFEDWDDGMFDWQYDVIFEMAEEFHDEGQFYQLPANLQERILSFKRMAQDSREARAEILGEPIPLLENYRFGNLDRESDWPEKRKESILKDIDNTTEEEWAEIDKILKEHNYA